MKRGRAARRKASVVDLFCGAGGLSYGFKSEGFALAVGIDIDEACRFPYVANNQAPFIRKDVGSLTAKDVETLFEPKSTRVLVGCAPCQPFSTYNQKNEDPNWRLLQSFGRLIDQVRPDVVSMENVPQLMKFRDGRMFKNVWPAPSASSFCDMTFASLHQRIRPVGIAPAKMEIRAFWSS